MRLTTHVTTQPVVATTQPNILPMDGRKNTNHPNHPTQPPKKKAQPPMFFQGCIKVSLSFSKIYNYVLLSWVVRVVSKCGFFLYARACAHARISEPVFLVTLTTQRVIWSISWAFFGWLVGWLVGWLGWLVHLGGAGVWEGGGWWDEMCGRDSHGKGRKVASLVEWISVSRVVVCGIVASIAAKEVESAGVVC